MNGVRSLDLHGILDHGNPDAVISSVASFIGLSYPGTDFSPVRLAFNLTGDLFAGRFPGYAPCRTGYHDYRHTIDVFVAAARLLDGGALLGRPLDGALALDVLTAALLHDAGYIQELGDESGSGARYTKTHVRRSADFVLRYAGLFGLSLRRAERCGRIIRGTELGAGWNELPFTDEAERRGGAVLAAADLLGQMADRAYLEKLLFLYFEFREAGIDGYETAFDVLRKTEAFYKGIAERLDGTLSSVSWDARAHFAARCGEDRDLYRDSIRRQMEYLALVVRDDSVNFRKRLRRIDLEQAERAETDRLRSLGVVFG